MPRSAGGTSGKTPGWFRGVRSRDGALVLGVLYLVFTVGAVVMASTLVGPPRWFWAMVGLGFLLLTLAAWTAARRLGGTTPTDR